MAANLTNYAATIGELNRVLAALLATLQGAQAGAVNASASMEFVVTERDDEGRVLAFKAGRAA